MTRSEIFDEIVAIGRRELAWSGALDPASRLVDDLLLDSLQLLTLAAEVENRFRIALSPEDDAAIATVGDLVEAVVAKLATAPDARPESR